MNYPTDNRGTQMNYQVQGTASYQSAGIVAEAPQTQPRFENIADRLANLPDNIAKACQRVRMLADRYGGPVPEAVSKAEGTGPATCLSSRLEISTNAIDQLLGQLHAQIDRLERF